MKSTIDKAGRVVIPKALRTRLGFAPGEVEILVDGAGLRIEAATGTDLERRGDRLVIPASGITITDNEARDLRDVDQK